MKKSISHSPCTGAKVVAGLVALSQVAISAETSQEKKEVESLEPTTFVATKFEKNLSDVSSSVEVLDVEQLKREGNVSLQDAIGYRVPGVIATSTAGQRGQLGSLFIRGTATDQSQVVVDGVRISDSNILPGAFLGAANVGTFSRIELLRGSQSAVYGGEAIGGVLGAYSKRAGAKKLASIHGEFGSFGSWLGELEYQATEGDLSYQFSVADESTQNDAAYNDFDQQTYFLRLDYDLNDSTVMGLTYRNFDSRYETPQFGPQLSHSDQGLLTLFVESDLSAQWHSRMVGGYFSSDLDIEGPGSVSSIDFEKFSVSLENEYTWTDAHVTGFGALAEYTDFLNAYDSAFYTSKTAGNRKNFGLYANHVWDVSDRLQWSNGVREDLPEDFASQFSWNSGLRYAVKSDAVLKMNVGRSFRSPSITERYGSVSNFGVIGESPNIRAEEALSWDVGIEKSWDTTQVSLTWFESDVEDAIVFDFVNPARNASGKTKASGLEVAANSRIEKYRTDVYASYTLTQRALETIIPEQAVSCGFDADVTDKLSVGVKASWIDERYLGNSLDDYLLMNLHGNYRVSENVHLHARVENLLDDHYLLANFTGPFTSAKDGEVVARGRGFYGGVTVTF